MTQEELDKMTPEERARMAEAEQKALRIMKYQMNEGGSPRRHRQMAILIGIPLMILLIFAIMAVASLFD